MLSSIIVCAESGNSTTHMSVSFFLAYAGSIPPGTMTDTFDPRLTILEADFYRVHGNGALTFFRYPDQNAATTPSPPRDASSDTGINAQAMPCLTLPVGAWLAVGMRTSFRYPLFVGAAPESSEIWRRQGTVDFRAQSKQLQEDSASPGLQEPSELSPRPSPQVKGGRTNDQGKQPPSNAQNQVTAAQESSRTPPTKEQSAAPEQAWMPEHESLRLGGSGSDMPGNAGELEELDGAMLHPTLDEQGVLTEDEDAKERNTGESSLFDEMLKPLPGLGNPSHHATVTAPKTQAITPAPQPKAHVPDFLASPPASTNTAKAINTPAVTATQAPETNISMDGNVWGEDDGEPLESLIQRELKLFLFRRSTFDLDAFMVHLGIALEREKIGGMAVDMPSNLFVQEVIYKTLLSKTMPHKKFVSGERARALQGLMPPLLQSSYRGNLIDLYSALQAKKETKKFTLIDLACWALSNNMPA